MWNTKPLIHFLLTALLLIFYSCGQLGEETGHHNPLDPDNQEIEGNPFALRTEIGDGGIVLTWEIPENIEPDKLHLYRNVNDEGFVLFEIISVSRRKHIDLDVRNGYTYKYYLVAIHDGQESSTSNLAEIKVHLHPFFVIDGDSSDRDTAKFTEFRNVTLTILAFSADRIRLSNDSDFTSSRWEEYVTKRNWTLKKGSGIKTVFLQVAYADKDTSSTISKSIYPYPLIPSLTLLPHDSSVISHRDIALYMPDVIANKVLISNSPDTTGKTWQDYSWVKSHNLSTSDGWKHVYAWFRNDFMEIEQAVDSIGLKTTIEIDTFFLYAYTNSDTLFPRDEIYFYLKPAETILGRDSRGAAFAHVEGWDPIPLIERGGGINYASTFKLPSLWNEVTNARVSFSFTDKVGNELLDIRYHKRITFQIPDDYKDRFPLGNTGSSITMIAVRPGVFQMGSSIYDPDSEDSERPQHEVTIGQGFWMSKYEVFQMQWEAVMGSNPSLFINNTRPVESVSRQDIQYFIDELNIEEGSDVWRLPTEAEWEYVCRAGTTSRFHWGDDSNYRGLYDHAWFRNNSGGAIKIGSTKTVGGKQPNPWGFYDMHGNVAELCEDDYCTDYLNAPDDGSAYIERTRSDIRVVRGGSYHINAEYCRSAARSSVEFYSSSKSIGFRLVKDFIIE
ncbi:MAG: formylglycine-generating enzyme family protein [Candidatus Electryonea clarkiae]|nr:formylglycine-generating enzyme family protein [Candidatus Electryonea clarkiae]MDP8288451.1 formylglycine-generating enzyme family protein [Candidatus Electryonea clarkiae]